MQNSLNPVLLFIFLCFWGLWGVWEMTLTWRKESWNSFVKGYFKYSLPHFLYKDCLDVLQIAGDLHSFGSKNTFVMPNWFKGMWRTANGLERIYLFSSKVELVLIVICCKGITQTLFWLYWPHSIFGELVVLYSVYL